MRNGNCVAPSGAFVGDPTPPCPRSDVTSGYGRSARWVVHAMAWLWLAWAAGCGGGTTAGPVVKEPVSGPPKTAKAPPAAPPKHLALKGREGSNQYGYPTRYADQVALRRMLYARQFADLTANFEYFQAKQEESHRFELWSSDATDAFASTEPELVPLFKAWVKASPSSFAPYVARASFWLAVARQRRGTSWARYTTEEQFAGQRDAHARASEDIARAIELQPRSVAAYRLRMRRLYGAPEPLRRRTLDAALAACPRCFQIRVVFMITQTPRWGGSYAAMAAFAAESERVANPKMRFLKGYIYDDMSNLLLIQRRYPEAVAAIDKACALGDYFEFLRKRAAGRRHAGDLDGALKDLNRAMEVRPEHWSLYFERARIHAAAKRWEPAAKDLLAGLAIQPTHSMSRRFRARIRTALFHRGRRANIEGNRQEFVRLMQLAHLLGRPAPRWPMPGRPGIDRRSPAGNGSTPLRRPGVPPRPSTTRQPDAPP